MLPQTKQVHVLRVRLTRMTLLLIKPTGMSWLCLHLNVPQPALQETRTHTHTHTHTHIYLAIKMGT